MWGAIIGDLAGSIYEYEQMKTVKPVENQEIIKKNSFFTRKLHHNGTLCGIIGRKEEGRRLLGASPFERGDTNV